MGMGFPFFPSIVDSGRLTLDLTWEGGADFFFFKVQEVSLVGEVLGEAKELSQGKVCKVTA